MGFLRNQQIKLAMHFLRNHYVKRGLPLPPAVFLQQQAARIVDDANRIARERGKNVLGILKELVAEIRK